MKKKFLKVVSFGACISMLAGVAGCSSKESTTDNDVKNPDITYEANTINEYNEAAANYTLGIDAEDEVHDISDLLFGIFIEDINFAADGGLYTEMVVNRSFEFTTLAANNQEHGWSDVGTVTSEAAIADAAGGLNANNTNYMVLTNTSGEMAGIANKGFLDGMSIEKDAAYDFSVYIKGLDGYTGSFTVNLMSGNDVAATATIDAVTSEWAKYECTLTSTVTASSGVKLQVLMNDGSAAVDMVSLLPQDNIGGLRTDLVEKLKELNPSFLRFPGGCVVEGVSLETAYDWKDSIGCDENGEPYEFNGTYGDVAARTQGQNIWTNEGTTNDPYPSFMTYGLGFYEYFCLAEEVGAIGVPVINAGKACQGQSAGASVATFSPKFEQYIQDALDLVEFCRGDASTEWGAVRIAMGHEEPFELKYVGIGNEQWGSDFFEHYEAFVTAFEEAREENPDMYGDIELSFTSGVDDGDSGHDMYIAAYNEAARWLKANPDSDITDYAGVIDHHYYNSPSWFFSHTDYYDEENYSRDLENMSTSLYGGGINVFLGEYAAQSNTLQAALAEAAYMTGLERNGDIVKMAAYAPLFGNLTATHWSPDLIWFNNHESTSSINYYVQQIFGQNVGDTLLASTFDGAKLEVESLKGKVGLGTWNTAAIFDNLVVTDNESGDEICKDDFETDDFAENWEKVSDGNWSVSDGQLVQSSAATNTGMYDTTGTAAYFGDADMSNYTLEVEATKTSGDEGFLIAFAVEGSNNNYFWNIGGWGNTVSCLQQVTEGTKSGQVTGTVKNVAISANKTYKLKVVVSDMNIKCYIDDVLYVDYNTDSEVGYESYQVVSTDETGDIIVKLVNVAEDNRTFAIDIANLDGVSDTATVYQVAGENLSDDNILGQEEAVSMETFELSGVSEKFNYTAPKYSVTVLRLHKD